MKPQPTLVLQSFRRQQVPDWIQRCMASVAGWASLKGYEYTLLGDEIFERVPDWYLRKVGPRMPILSDYARLCLVEEMLADGYQQVIWCDADTLIWDASGLQVAFEGSCAFGQEHWVQLDSPCRYRVVKNVHNAFCVFRQGCVVLPFLRQTVASLIARVDPQRIAPQMVGPKLLTALHNIAHFNLLPQCGALSPEVLHDISLGEGEALALQRRRQQECGQPLQAANLCASLVDENLASTAVQRLLSQKQL